MSLLPIHLNKQSAPFAGAAQLITGATWRAISHLRRLLYVALLRGPAEALRDADLPGLMAELLDAVLLHESDLHCGLSPQVLLVLDLSQTAGVKRVRPSAFIKSAEELVHQRMPDAANSVLFVILPDTPSTLYDVWRDSLSTAFLHFVPPPLDTETDQFFLDCFEKARAENASYWREPPSFQRIIYGEEILEAKPAKAKFGKCPVLMADRQTLMWGEWADAARTSLCVPNVEADCWRVLNAVDTADLLRSGVMPPLQKRSLVTSPTTASPPEPPECLPPLFAKQSAPPSPTDSFATPVDTGGGDDLSGGDWQTVTNVACSTTCDRIEGGGATLSEVTPSAATPTPFLPLAARASPARQSSCSDQSDVSEGVVVNTQRLGGPLGAVCTPRSAAICQELADLSLCDVSEGSEPASSSAGSAAAGQASCCMILRRKKKA